MEKLGIEDSLGSLISKANWYIKTYFNQLIKENGLNVTTEQWVVLMIINKNPGITQTDIAKNVLKDKTNITRILDVLEKNNYIIRQNDRNNRRIFKIFLTTDGEKILKLLLPLADKVNKTGSVNFNEDELNITKLSLKKICDTFKTIIEK